MTTTYRRYHFASHLAVLTGILANAVAEADPLIFLIGATGVGVSYSMFRDRLTSPVPRWVANTMLLAALVLMFRAATGQLEDVVSVVAQYLVYLQLVKLFETRTARDQAQLLMLSLLVAISAVLTSVTLQTALVLLVYMPLAFWTVVLYQVYAGQLRTHSQRVRAGLAEAQNPPGKPLDRIARRTVRRLVFVTMVGVSLTATVVFLLMPREIGSGAFGDWQPANYGATSGFNNEVRLGRPGTLTESPTVVMEAQVRVRLEGRDPNPYRPGQVHRLRGAVLDEFDPVGAVWRRSREAERRQQAMQVFPGDHFPLNYETKGAYVELLVSIRNLNSSELFTLWKPEKLAVPGPRRRVTISSADGVVRLRNHRGPISYSVLTDPDAPVRVSRSNREPILDHPERNIFAAEGSRIRRLALEIIGDRVPGFDPNDPASVLQPGVAEVIVAYLDDYLSSNYAYTLDMMTVEPGEDAIEAFLFRNRAGHCEYFASALAALCRSVWIDARVITGFVATEFDPATQTYTVRQSHAHAWVEALVDRRLDPDPEPDSGNKVQDMFRTGVEGPVYIETWKTYDPSPRQSLEAIHTPPTGLLSRFGQWFDQLQFAWSSKVIGFDRDRQSELLNADSDGPFGLFRRARDLAGKVGAERIPRSIREDLMRSLISFASLAAVVVLTIGGFFILKRLVDVIRKRVHLRSHPADVEALRRARQTRFFNQALSVLEKAGAGRPQHLPAGAYASDLRAEAPEAGAALAGLSRLYYESRYGQRLLTERELEAAQAMLEKLRDGLRQRVA
ncbi:MAG: DUF3488 and DUF4129 domain-containing transglutaminase family protein [Phycisphaerales bacterium JB050]